MRFRRKMPIAKTNVICRACILRIKVNPNTTFYSYYFFPRASRSDFEVLFLFPHYNIKHHTKMVQWKNTGGLKHKHKKTAF